MTIARRKFVELPSTPKLLALHPDQKNEGSSNRDPAFNFEVVSELLRSRSSARAYARTHALAERAYTRPRYGVGHLALGRRFRVATLARRLGTGITAAGHTLFQLVPANAAHANRRSGVVVGVPMPVELGELLKGRVSLEGIRLSVASSIHLMSGRSEFERLPEVPAFRAAILECGQRSLLGLHIGRTWSWIGPVIGLMPPAAIGRLGCIASLLEQIIGTSRCRTLKRARNCMLHDISAGMISCFNTVVDEQSSPPHSRRMSGFPLEKTPKHCESGVVNG